MNSFFTQRTRFMILALLAMFCFLGCEDEITQVQEPDSSVSNVYGSSLSSPSSGPNYVCVTITGKQIKCDHNPPFTRSSAAFDEITSSSENQSSIESSSSLSSNTFLDTRDGRVYSTVKLGAQTWFAENLSYNKSKEYYEFEDARAACPPGTHLPSEYEWSVLLENYSFSTIEGSDIFYSLVGNWLKSKNGWLGRDVGEDQLGFNAYPSGYVYDNMVLQNGYQAEFWTSTAVDRDFSRVVRLVANDHYAMVTTQSNRVGISVRCVVGDTLVSSSSSIASSVSSSSSVVAIAKVVPSGTYDCRQYDCVTTENLSKDYEYKEILDSRDNKVYRVVETGDAYWLAQNLDYKIDDSYCGFVEGAKDMDCQKYGRLYNWDNAMVVCPAGWYLPSTYYYLFLDSDVKNNNPLYNALAFLKVGRFDTPSTYLTVSDGETGTLWTSADVVGNPGLAYVANVYFNGVINAATASLKYYYIQVRCMQSKY